MKKTKSDDSRENVEHDRISDMPDEVLTHILSFLSTKEAVSTCVLSKRWINTWATVPVLDFNLNEFLSEDLISNPGGEREERKCVARFEKFVHGVLNNHESTNLDIVCYMRPMLRGETFVPMKWLDRVALLMPRVFVIYISRVDYMKSNYVDLPDSVFSSAKLQHLQMNLSIDESPIIRPASINLPLLKGGGAGISLKKAINLVNATIRLFFLPWFDGVPVLDLLSGLSSATKLHLYFDSHLKEPVEEDVSNCRNFKNLKKLNIGMWDTSYDFYLIACLLQCSPNLNELNLFLNMRQGKIQKLRREVLGDVFFRHEYLETVKIRIKSMSELPSDYVENLMKTLDKYIKKIGNISIIHDP